MDNITAALELLEQVKSLLHVEVYNVFTSRVASREERARVHDLWDKAYWLREDIASLIRDIEDGEV